MPDKNETPKFDAPILPARVVASFHDEMYMECPHCKHTFETYSATHVKGMKNVFLCPSCKKPFYG